MRWCTRLCSAAPADPRTFKLATASSKAGMSAPEPSLKRRNSLLSSEKELPLGCGTGTRKGTGCPHLPTIRTHWPLRRRTRKLVPKHRHKQGRQHTGQVSTHAKPQPTCMVGWCLQPASMAPRQGRAQPPTHLVACLKWAAVVANGDPSPAHRTPPPAQRVAISRGGMWCVCGTLHTVQSSPACGAVCVAPNCPRAPRLRRLPRSASNGLSASRAAQQAPTSQRRRCRQACRHQRAGACAVGMGHAKSARATSRPDVHACMQLDLNHFAAFNAVEVLM